MSINITVESTVGGSFTVGGVESSTASLTVSSDGNAVQSVAVAGGVGPQGPAGAQGPAGPVSDITGGTGIDAANSSGHFTLTLNASLDMLSDVSVAGASAGHVLTYNGTAWEPAADNTNLSGYATESYVDGAISNLVGTAPALLDTLGELADALADDEAFAATVTTALAGKAAINHTHEIADVTGLQAALDNRSLIGHAHTSADVSDFAAAAAANAPIQSLNSLTGSLTIAGSGGVSVSAAGSTITIGATIPPSGVESLNGETGNLTLVAGTGVTISTGTGSITIASTATGGGNASAVDGGEYPQASGLLTEGGDNLTAESGDTLTAEGGGSGAVIQLLRSGVQDAAPTSLAYGELALNYHASSPAIYWKSHNGTITSYPLSGGGGGGGGSSAYGSLLMFG